MKKIKNNLKFNLIFQTLYQLLETCIPLITAPYLSRTLGAEKLGVFSYTSSIVAFFALFAMLGTQNYGTKSIASVNKDIDKRSKLFFEIYGFQLIVCAISIIVYILYLVFFCNENKLISTVQILTLVGCIFNINWFFFGMEQFKVTVSVNSVIRVVSVIFIFLFVKKPSDLWVYSLIILSSTCVSHIYLLGKVKNYIHFRKTTLSDIFIHLRPNIVLFVPLLAMSVYHIMDKTMLGFISDYNQSGYYYNADKIINITAGVISGISTVLLPRMSYLVSNDRKDESVDLFCLSLESTVMAASAMSFGIATISKEFIPFFFGPGFQECIILTITLSPVIIIKAFSFTARYQYLIPNNREYDFLVSVILGAIFNIILNFLLIPKFGAMGAVIGTLIAELVACIWQFIVLSKYIRIISSIVESFSYIFIGVLMFFAVRVIANYLTYNLILNIFIEIIFGIVVYTVLCLIYWNYTDSNIGNYIRLNYLVKNKIFKR